MNRNQSKATKSIWFTPDKTHYFLIPNELQLPTGDFMIRTATGRAIQVAPDAVKAFEISKEQSNAWLKEQLGSVMSQLKTGLKDTLFKQETKKAKAEGNNQENSTTPGLDLLADITDTPRDDLNDNDSAVGQALKSYLTDITSTVSDVASGEPERQQLARERMHNWGNTLREHGIQAPETEDADNHSDDKK